MRFRHLLKAHRLIKADFLDLSIPLLTDFASFSRDYNAAATAAAASAL